MIARTPCRAERRRGMILLVVLAILTLLAILGIAFVLYANAEAEASRLACDAESTDSTLARGWIPGTDAGACIAYFLGQLIYDVPDDVNGVYSALRGHSLSRTMYGFVSLDTNGNPIVIPDKPFTGSGRLHKNVNIDSTNTSDDFPLVNYTFFPSVSPPGYIRHPDYIDSQAGGSPSAPPPPVGANFAGQLNVPYTYPDVHNMALAMVRASDGQVLMPSFHRPWLFNPNWPASGQFDTAANNPHWTDAVGKYLLLRPRPAEHDPAGTFPFPGDPMGDVKNWPSAPGGNDSIWLDLGAPVQQTSTGTKYKALFAPLIIELDGRVNLNAAGNIMGLANSHASNQGWGLWEVNFYKTGTPVAPSSDGATLPTGTINVVSTSGFPTSGSLLVQTDSGVATVAYTGTTGTSFTGCTGGTGAIHTGGTVAPAELQNILLGNAQTGNQGLGRYGSGGLPVGAPITPGTGARPWAGVDYNGTADPYQGGPATGPITLPGFGSQPGYTAFPLFPTAYGNGTFLETTRTGLPGGTPTHASIYNPLAPASGNNLVGGGRPSFQFQATLLRYDANNLDVPSDYLYSDLRKLCPNTLGTAGNNKFRKLTGVVSTDLDRVGANPYVWDPTDANTKFSWSATPTYPSYPTAVSAANPTGTLPFPQLATLQGTPPAGSEFDVNTRRSSLQQTIAALTLSTSATQAGKLDLNRKLTAYPAKDPTTWVAADQSQAAAAIQDRQNFAQDIYRLLCVATGCRRPDDTTLAGTPPAFGTADYNAARYLAQLAANIVDFIDQDDYSTPFRWDTTPANQNLPNQPTYVFGVELPRLVLNEAYIQVDNDWTDPAIMTMNKQQTFYNVNTWVELHNPLTEEPSNSPIYPQVNGNPGYGRNDSKAILATGANPATATPIYRIVIAKPNITATLRDPSNVTGDPDFGLTAPTTNIQTNNSMMPAQPCKMEKWTNAPTDPYMVLPINQAFVDAAAANNGFFAVGPDPSVFQMGTDPTKLPVKLTSKNMTFTIPANSLAFTGMNDTGMIQPWPTILLQRLACPGLPYNPTPGSTGYQSSLPVNPWITVDYIENNNNRYVNEGRTYDSAGMLNPAAPAMTSRTAWGRPQPYAAVDNATIGGNPTQIRQKMNPQNTGALPGGSGANEPLNTFYCHNAVYGSGSPLPAPVASTPNQTLQLPFNWYPFLDRQLVSPMELLMVPAVKPDQFTQQFAAYPPTLTGDLPADPYGAVMAPWQDPASRLHRFLELVQAKNRYAGTALGGRVPGKININTVWDKEILRALCDAQPGNRFYYDTTAGPPNAVRDALVDTLFNSLVGDRSPTADGSGNPGAQMPGPNDRPFWGMALGHASDAQGSDPLTALQPGAPPTIGATGDPYRGLRNTLLRTVSPNTTPLLNPFTNISNTNTNPVIHPYQQFELLNKILNNVTTRSNVYAVWITVGFFTVVDDSPSQRPVKLGAEVGLATGQNVRYRGFALIDRTNLTAFQATVNPVSVNTNSQGQPVPTTVNLTLRDYTDQLTQNTWTVTPGAGGTYTVTDSRNPRTMTVGTGTVLVLDPDSPTEETVMVTASGGNLQAMITQSHGSGRVICRGNPGPWTRYSPTKDPSVVLYWAILP